MASYILLSRKLKKSTDEKEELKEMYTAEPTAPMLMQEKALLYFNGGRRRSAPTSGHSEHRNGVMTTFFHVYVFLRNCLKIDFEV